MSEQLPEAGPASGRDGRRRPRALARRVLALGIGALVVGTAGGVLAAATLGDRDGEGGSADPSATNRPGPLWADREALHDGDVTVPLRLVDAPSQVQRFDGGWVLNVAISHEDPSSVQTSLVRPDGTVSFLARTLGAGEVSADGTHYLAGTRDGYVEWDLTTGEAVDVVPEGRGGAQTVLGGAQYVDRDTVATTWGSPDGLAPRVLLSRRGAGDARVLADDILGPWGISPDGRWFVGTLAVRGSGIPTAGCTVLRPVPGRAAGPDADVEDCGGTIEGVPSFLPDSSAVLRDPGGRTGSRDAGFELLPLAGRTPVGTIEAPVASLRAGVVDPEEILVVGPRAYGYTPILVCAASSGCREVGRSGDDPREIAVAS